jgi:hypothetical protein
MKNYIILFVILISGVSLSAQGAYTEGMKKGMNLWQEGKAMEASALFERIASAEKDNWIPCYYAAQTLITESFQNGDASLKNEILEKAKVFVESAHERSPNNSEVTTLEGLLYTGYVAMDPGTYGMKYSQKIMELHSRAIMLDAENPRAHANKIEYEMGSAKFFNQDPAPLCAKMKKILPLFDKQKSTVAFAPSYGKDRVEQVVKECGI